MSPTENLLKLPKVMAKTGLTRSPLYTRMKEGTFPAPIQLGPRSVAWVESEVSAWIDEQVRTAPRSAAGAVKC